jgi:hypothetical protein
MSTSRIKPDTLLILGVAVGGLYLAYQLVKGARAAAGAVVDAGAAVYHGAQTVLDPVSSGIALLLGPGPSTMGVLGNVIFPDGYGAPLSSYKLLQDTQGGVYVKDRGSTWRLGQSDPDGDWPATYVSG